jgi:hypothetical protein
MLAPPRRAAADRIAVQTARYGRACLLALGLTLADTPTALAQEPAPVAQVEEPSPPETLQLASKGPRRPRRPPLGPEARKLRQTRGLLAGGIVFTALCGAGFGLFVYTVVDAGKRLQGSSGDRVVAAGGAMLACTFLSVAAIGVSSHRLRALNGSGRVAWTGGFGFRF